MTWDEFRGTWYPEHCACFTGIPAWLSKQETSNNVVAARDVLKSWYAVLRDVDVKAAIEASHRMHAGEIDEPKGYDRHPAAIRKACGIAKRDDPRRPRYDADGNQTYACLRCRDVGIVLIWHPETIQKIAKKGLAESRPHYTCVVRCTCRVGDIMSRDAARYDEKRHCPKDSSAVNDDYVLEWIADNRPDRPKNFEPAFEQFETQAGLPF